MKILKTMSRVQRGERLLAAMVAADKLTPSGRDWLTAAMDPFHDTQLKNLTGYPDMETGASVVRCVKQTMTISKPAVLAAGNWDCHIVMWPMLTNNGGTGANYSLCTRNQNCIDGPAFPVVAANALIGGIQVYATPPNADLNILAPGTAGNTVLIGSLNVASTYTQGAGRCIGIGFEVHNTTAELTRQGSVTVYRLQEPTRDPETMQYANVPTPYSGSFSAVPIRYPPKNSAEAILTAGGRTWDAEKGVYVVGAFNSTENPAFPCSTTCPVIATSGGEDVDCNLNGSSLYVCVPKNVRNAQPVLAPQRVHPFHQSGSIFNGLSDTTTLQLNWNTLIETFPGLAEADLLPLANPSAAYDPCALEVYSRTISYMPVGVPVDMNGLGEWFLDAVSKAAQFVGPLLTAAPHPIAKGAGAALTFLGQSAAQHQAPKKKKPQNEMTTALNVWKPPKGPPPALPPRNAPATKRKAKAKQKARAQRARNNA